VLKQPGETASARALPHERYAFDHLQLEDPLQVAEQVAIVDQVSHGRFMYGAGGRTRGSDDRREHFSGFAGTYYHDPAFYEPYLAIPKPYQKPYPPMLLPGG
jgi:hypothetical protein